MLDVLVRVAEVERLMQRAANSPAMRTSSSPLPGVTWRIRLISPTWKIAINGSA
ncbi:hypothetical protein ABEV34_26535 [Methylorubrum rhodesianum]|uniref:hypothetical protein n=1 Tax=Methylorubrum TaxID=2282523 RepID=UPI00182BAC1C|nr:MULTISPECIES: hypothetical protein [Methylorubrum]MBB5760648.1 hypothetical protein [Methylorubrum rhodesianum]